MTEINLKKITAHLYKQVSAAPIAVYRIGFGILMFISTIRFISYGWVESQYIEPKFHFRFEFFDWLPFPSETGIWTLFILILISSALITLGLFYRIAAVIFFVCFTYVEILDKTNYLNHYYFVSLIAFLLILIPANRHFSLDAKLGLSRTSETCSLWEIRILQFQIAIVYFYAGLAKLNYDWLFNAQPLKYWLHTANHWAIVGDWLKQDWIAYLFSWFGAIYDLLIVFFLLIPKTRKVAYFFVIAFHIITWMLFPIGIFPWVMIFATMIFFNQSFHQKIIQFLRKIFKIKTKNPQVNPINRKPILSIVLALFITFQLLFPLRFLLSEGPIFWTENGYRFSWRVMLMEKTGYATFFLRQNNTSIEIKNSDYLTPNQEKMMSTQPDMILQYAHHLAEVYKDTTINKFGHDFEIFQPEIHAEVFVTLNSRPHQLYVDENIDLSKIKLTDKRDWLQPFINE